MALTEQPPVAVPPAPRLAHRRSVLASRRRQVAAAVVIGAAVAFLVVEGLGNATQYYKTVPQALADRAHLGASQFRIMGTVDPDVRQVDHLTEFSITYDNATARVIDSTTPTGLFKAGVPVVIEGHWAGAVFDGDLVMVKHTSSYTPPTDPGTLLPPGQSS